MNLKKMTVAELYTELSAAITQTAAGILRMAKVLAELQSRREDLSSFTSPLLMFLPDVASGKLLPEMLIRYGASPAIVSMIAKLVQEDQKKLATGDGKVEVVEEVGKEPRRARLIDMTQARLTQVIGGGHIRSPSEQTKHMAPPPKPYMAPPPKPYTPRPAQRPLDLAPAMDLGQWTVLCDKAEKAAKTPEQLLILWAVQFNKLPPAKVAATREQKAALRDKFQGQSAHA